MILKKRYGQNFLRNGEILRFIASLTSKCNSILEVGAGDGRLTKHLLNSSKRIYAVEIDKELCPKLSAIPGLNLICSDFLKIQPFPVDCIVGNIPYYITSKIIFSLIDWEFNKAVIMVQKEFAEKMVADHTNSIYGRLSITSKYYFDVEILRTISRKNFFPVPKVDSALLCLKKKRGKRDVVFDQFIRTLFSLKNKKIKNVLKMESRFSEKRARHLSFDEVLELFEEYKDKILLNK